ncbi:MAG: 2-isopropylmalate synthase [Desulfurococcaceae archaeon]
MYQECPDFNNNLEGEEYYRGIYPFKEVPRFCCFDKKDLMNDLNKIYLTDTTLRDGQQGWRVFTINECERIYELLAEFGKAVKSTEVFLYTEKDQLIAKRLVEYGYEYPKVIGWIRATRSDLKLVMDARLDETVVLASISDYHIKHKFNLTRGEAIRKYLDVIEEALRNGIVPRVSLEDITRADVENVVLPFIKRLLKLGERYGLPVKIKLPDTLGLGLPFYEVSLPRSIPRIIIAIRSLGVPSENIEFHGHNDFGLVVANQLAAWIYGAGGANCTLMGIGERAGNCPLEVMAIHYAGIKGSSEINLRAVAKVPELLENMGYRIPDHYPFIGKNAFTTRAGIHVDGLVKNPEVYLPFDPIHVLGIPFSIAITPYSGRSAIVLWIRNHLGRKDVNKDDPRVIAIYKEILEYFEKTGRTTPLDNHEVLSFIKKYF